MSNLLSIESALTDVSIETLVQKYDGKGYGDFKASVAQVIIDHFAPIQARYEQLINSSELDEILDRGAEKAQVLAKATLAKMEDAMGLGRRRQ